MFKTMIVVLATDKEAEMSFEAIIRGRRICGLHPPTPVEKLRGRLATITMDGCHLIWLYSTTKDESHLRYVRVRDIKNTYSAYTVDQFSDALSLPIDNIKTVLEFLSL